MEEHTLTDDDAGKSVVDANGDKVGIISEVRGGTAYVDPDPGITDRVRSMLDWGEADQDTYPLREESIDTVTGDEVRLREAH